jgi:hypothetical protein
VAQEAAVHTQSPALTGVDMQTTGMSSSGAAVDLLADTPALNTLPVGEANIAADQKTRDFDVSSPTAIISQELVFVDAGIRDYARLVDDLLAETSEDTDFEVIVLDIERDGIGQISEALAERQDLDAVHFVTPWER